MLILGVDTTRDRMVAVLSDENKTYYKVSDEGNKKHTSKLLPVIDELLSENGFTRRRGVFGSDGPREFHRDKGWRIDDKRVVFCQRKTRHRRHFF